MSYSDLGGKIAIVTGAARGIGLSVSQRLAAEGCIVVGADIREPESRPFTEFTTADVSDPAAATQLVTAVTSRHDHIDYLVNNAGRESSGTPLGQASVEDFDAAIATNVRSVFVMLSVVLPAMYAQGGGSVVNLASQASVRGVPRLAPYVAAKHAVLGLTRTAALEAGPRGVRVNAVAPGQIETSMMRHIEQSWADEEHSAFDVKVDITRAIPLGRYGLSGEVAAAVAYLLSAESSFVNGALLSVDGGTTA